MGVLAEGVWWFGVEGIRGQMAEGRGQSDKVSGGCGVLGGLGLACYLGGGSWDFRFGQWALGFFCCLGAAAVSQKECGVFIANGDLGAVLRGFSYRMKGVVRCDGSTLADEHPVAPGETKWTPLRKRNAERLCKPSGARRRDRKKCLHVC